ncbi:MAG: hypothetical protein MJZ74_02330 [Muribaculaceae bacterium]|nr:hypothetical protein [Muribaculaceae bacterium]
MKKLLFAILAAFMCVLATQAQSFPGGVTYKNAQWGFSVQLPAGFRPQNQDKAMELERGGKVYIKRGCMVDMQASDCSGMGITPAEAVANDAAWVMIDESAGEQLICKDVSECDMLAKWTDEFGIRALYVKYVGNVKYEIAITYDLSMTAEFNTEVDKIVASLATK